jgi:hypothetical protein
LAKYSHQDLGNGMSRCVSAARAEPHHRVVWLFFGTKERQSVFAVCSATSSRWSVATAGDAVDERCRLPRLADALANASGDMWFPRDSPWRVSALLRLSSPREDRQWTLVRRSFAWVRGLLWRQRISAAKRLAGMGSRSRVVAGARDARCAKLWVSDFGR